MEYLIWAGTGISFVGLIGIIYCILMAFKAKRANLPEEEMRARLQKVVALNMGALMLSMIGLMLVIVGIVLG